MSEARRERVEELLKEFRPRVEELASDALAEVAEADREASEKIGRHGEVVRELARVEKQLAEIRSEREGLPDRAYRAGLDEDYEREDDLKERYRNLRAALSALEELEEALREEQMRLDPRQEGHPRSAEVYWEGSVTRVANEAAKDLLVLRDGLVGAVEDATRPVFKQRDEARGRGAAIRSEMEWEMAARARQQPIPGANPLGRG